MIITDLRVSLQLEMMSVFLLVVSESLSLMKYWTNDPIYSAMMKGPI